MSSFVISSIPVYVRSLYKRDYSTAEENLQFFGGMLWGDNMKKAGKGMLTRPSPPDALRVDMVCSGRFRRWIWVFYHGDDEPDDGGKRNRGEEEQNKDQGSICPAGR